MGKEIKMSKNGEEGYFIEEESIDEVDHVRTCPPADIPSRPSIMKRPLTDAIKPDHQSGHRSTGKDLRMYDSKRYFGRGLMDSGSTLASCKSFASEMLLMSAPSQPRGLNSMPEASVILGNMVDNTPEEIRKMTHNLVKKKKKIPTITYVPLNFKGNSQSKCEEPAPHKIKSKKLKEIINSQCGRHHNSATANNLHQIVTKDIDAIELPGVGSVVQFYDQGNSNFTVQDFQTNINPIIDVQVQKWMDPLPVPVVVLSEAIKAEEGKRAGGTEEMSPQTDINDNAMYFDTPAHATAASLLEDPIACTSATGRKDPFSNSPKEEHKWKMLSTINGVKRKKRKAKFAKYYLKTNSKKGNPIVKSEPSISKNIPGSAPPKLAPTSGVNKVIVSPSQAMKLMFRNAQRALASASTSDKVNGTNAKEILPRPPRPQPAAPPAKKKVSFDLAKNAMKTFERLKGEKSVDARSRYETRPLFMPKSPIVTTRVRADANYCSQITNNISSTFPEDESNEIPLDLDFDMGPDPVESEQEASSAPTSNNAVLAREAPEIDLSAIANSNATAAEDNDEDDDLDIIQLCADYTDFE